MDATNGHDPVLEALASLERFIHSTEQMNEQLLARVEFIRQLRREGQPYKEIVPQEERPLIVEVLSKRLQDLSEASSCFRRAEAKALYAEGLTMAEIATFFGVTRQRVATLLRDEPAGDENGGDDDPEKRSSKLRRMGGQAARDYSIWVLTSPLAALGATTF